MALVGEFVWLLDLLVGLFCWLVGWFLLFGWLVGLLVRQLLARLVVTGWLVGWLVGWFVGLWRWGGKCQQAKDHRSNHKTTTQKARMLFSHLEPK